MSRPQLEIIRRVLRGLALACTTLILASCGGGDGVARPAPPPDPPAPPPPPPPDPSSVSILLGADTSVAEELNPKVNVSIQLSAPASEPISVVLSFAGTATRDYDYAVDTDTVMIATDESAGTATVDIYRDFEIEGDETIEVSLGTITGNAEIGTPSNATLTIHDEPVAIDDPEIPFDPTDETLGASLSPLLYTATEEGVQIAVLATWVPFDGSQPSIDLVAEWSTDRDFLENKHEFGRVEIHQASDNDNDDDMVEPVSFLLPLEVLEPSTVYYVRINFGDPPDETSFGEFIEGIFFDGFRTDAHGDIVVSCHVGERSPDGTKDPLFEHQWHLVNVGQTAFAEEGGVAGADLRMTAAIASGLDGAGVKIGIVDSGLEICHPDLAGNVLVGASHNFAYGRRVGALPHDPFLFSILGDHGTSVAGVAAAVAENGLGGRGVGAGASLVGFNPVESGSFVGEDTESVIRTAFLESLGGSDSNPASSEIDIFNMSFGIFSGPEPIDEELLSLYQMATRYLREGLGAIYVKAAGNAYDYCPVPHLLQQEIGCESANSEPDQNVPYVINVGAFNAEDLKSSYSSTGANLWVVAPSSGIDSRKPGIITTDQVGVHAGYSVYPESTLPSTHELNLHGDYEAEFGGTSAAAPATAGAIAVMLEVQPDLTWRDVKHVLASTARQIDSEHTDVRIAFNGTPYIVQHGWRSNAAGYLHHNWYGFGAVDLDAAVSFLRTYEPNSLGEQVLSDWFDADISADASLAIPDRDGKGASTTVEIAGLPTGANIEAVVLSVSVDHDHPFDVAVAVQSPAGTRSVVNQPYNATLISEAGFHDWQLLSNVFYGENPNGTWTINVADLLEENTGSWTRARLRFYYGQHRAN